MSIQAILLPVFVQIGLIYFLGFWMARDRVLLFARGQVRYEEMALRENVWPARTKQIGNAYSNQFEVPSLFFVLVTLAIVTRKADLAFVILEWVFVLSRIAHAVVHTTSNHVPTRGRLFVVGVTILLVMWIIFAIRILLSPSFDIP
ncbi:MAG TPA: MAPEG family protein [Beijerinckia sp.]|nr:MAPEG family protein [Beijerinckia sp.]